MNEEEMNGEEKREKGRRGKEKGERLVPSLPLSLCLSFPPPLLPSLLYGLFLLFSSLSFAGMSGRLSDCGWRLVSVDDVI